MCDLCGKETFTEFTVKSKHLRWVLSEDLQKLDTHKNNWLTKNICEDCFKKIFGKLEEDHTIEQEKTACEKCIDSGRKIDCGKCDIQKELEQQHYRPFIDTAELILHYEKHFNVDYPSFYEPMMWVKVKDESDARFFIMMFSEHYVKIDGEFVSMKKLFENFVFLDNSPCGSKE